MILCLTLKTNTYKASVFHSMFCQNTISYILSQTESCVAVCSLDLYPVFLSLAEESCHHLKVIVIMDLNEVNHYIYVSQHGLHFLLQNEEVNISLLMKPMRTNLMVCLFSNLILGGSKDPVDMSVFKYFFLYNSLTLCSDYASVYVDLIQMVFSQQLILVGVQVGFNSDNQKTLQFVQYHRKWSLSVIIVILINVHYQKTIDLL